MEEQAAVYSPVRFLLLLCGPGSDQPKRPPLELEPILSGECLCIVHRNGFANHAHPHFVPLRAH